MQATDWTSSSIFLKCFVQRWSYGSSWELGREVKWNEVDAYLAGAKDQANKMLPFELGHLLILAINDNRFNTAKRLVDANADVNATVRWSHSRCSYFSWKACRAEGSALSEICQKPRSSDKTQIVRMLIDNNANVNGSEGKGTPLEAHLHQAAFSAEVKGWRGHNDRNIDWRLIRYLAVDRGAYLSEQNVWSLTRYFSAVRKSFDRLEATLLCMKEGRLRHIAFAHRQILMFIGDIGDDNEDNEEKGAKCNPRDDMSLLHTKLEFRHRVHALALALDVGRWERDISAAGAEEKFEREQRGGVENKEAGSSSLYGVTRWQPFLQILFRDAGIDDDDDVDDNDDIIRERRVSSPHRILIGNQMLQRLLCKAVSDRVACSDVLKAFLRLGVEINGRVYFEGDTKFHRGVEKYYHHAGALHLACEGRGEYPYSLATVKLLLRSKADINAYDVFAPDIGRVGMNLQGSFFGKTPLGYAISRAHEFGDWIYYRDYDDYEDGGFSRNSSAMETKLHHRFSNVNWAVVGLLLHRGAIHDFQTRRDLSMDFDRRKRSYDVLAATMKLLRNQLQRLHFAHGKILEFLGDIGSDFSRHSREIKLISDKLKIRKDFIRKETCYGRDSEYYFARGNKWDLDDSRCIHFTNEFWDELLEQHRVRRKGRYMIRDSFEHLSPCRVRHHMCLIKPKKNKCNSKPRRSLLGVTGCRKKQGKNSKQQKHRRRYVPKGGRRRSLIKRALDQTRRSGYA